MSEGTGSHNFLYLDFSPFSRSLYVINIYISKQQRLSFPRKVGASLSLPSRSQDCSRVLSVARFLSILQKVGISTGVSALVCRYTSSWQPVFLSMWSCFCQLPLSFSVSCTQASWKGSNHHKGGEQHGTRVFTRASRCHTRAI